LDGWVSEPLTDGADAIEATRESINQSINQGRKGSIDSTRSPAACPNPIDRMDAPASKRAWGFDGMEMEWNGHQYLRLSSVVVALKCREARRRHMK
jgi:hypothetical protein